MGTKLWLSSLVFIVFITTTLVGSRFIVGEQRHYAEQQRYRTLTELNSLGTEIDSTFQAHLNVLRTLQAQIAFNPQVSEAELQRITDFLLTDELAIEHLAFAPDLVIRYLYPTTDNETALGFHYADDPVQYASVRQAVEHNELVIDGPVELVQGGTAMIARAPVFQSETGELWGIVSVVINYRELLAGTRLGDFTSLQVSLTRGDPHNASQVLWGDPAAHQAEPVATHISLPYGQLQLAATPADGDWVSLNRSWLPYWLALAGLVVILTTLVAWVAWSRFRLQDAFSTITRQAHYDSLTGLLNRASFHQQLAAELAQVPTASPGFAVLFVDLDHFKDINDSHGHQTGDALLQVIAQRLQQCVRAEDSVARLGGDEFIILLRHTTHSRSLQVKAKAIQEALSRPMNLANTELVTNCSMGIAVCPADGDNATDLMRAADLAMYAAKNSGRGRFHFHNELLRQEADTHNRLFEELEQALQENQLTLWYQPIRNASTGQLVALEALIRWHHPREGLVSPDYFIPTAEKTGLIRKIGCFALKQACSDYKALQRAGIETHLTLNFSSIELQDAQTVQDWFQILSSEQVDPACFTFEITESMLMPQRQQQRDLLRDISRQGVTLAVDDFGTGYSSAHYLRTFPVKLLKIDRSFLQQVPTSVTHSDLLRALLQMGQALQLKVVVEGVENQVQLDFLTSLQVEFVQGYLFARPQPLAQIMQAYEPHHFREKGFGASQ